jgi:hypothetical protein
MLTPRSACKEAKIGKVKLTKPGEHSWPKYQAKDLETALSIADQVESLDQ